MLLLAFSPSALCGLCLGIFHLQPSLSLGTLGWPLLLGGVYLLLFEHFYRRSGLKKLRDIGAGEALAIGAFQAVALVPGVSRSLMTLTVAMLVGLSVPAAVEFSFFLGACTIAAAAAYELLFGGLAILAALPIVPTLLGIFTAFCCAIPSLIFLRKWLSVFTLRPFGYYRILLGIFLICAF
jgi:undecaprenyl-diphosphatase